MLRWEDDTDERGIDPIVPKTKKTNAAAPGAAATGQYGTKTTAPAAGKTKTAAPGSTNAASVTYGETKAEKHSSPAVATEKRNALSPATEGRKNFHKTVFETAVKKYGYAFPKDDGKNNPNDDESDDFFMQDPYEYAKTQNNGETPFQLSAKFLTSEKVPPYLYDATENPAQGKTWEQKMPDGGTITVHNARDVLSYTKRGRNGVKGKASLLPESLAKDLSSEETFSLLFDYYNGKYKFAFASKHLLETFLNFDSAACAGETGLQQILAANGYVKNEEYFAKEKEIEYNRKMGELFWLAYRNQSGIENSALFLKGLEQKTNDAPYSSDISPEMQKDIENYIALCAYDELRLQEDFPEKCEYDASLVSVGNQEYNTDGTLYRLINDDSYFYAVSQSSNEDEELIDNFMTNEEKQLYNYISNTQGVKEGRKYFELLRRELNIRKKDKIIAAVRAFTRKLPITANILTVLAAPFKTVTFLIQLCDLIEDGEVDENEIYNSFCYTTQAARDETEAVIRELCEEKGVHAGTAAVGYRMAMGFLDSLAEAGAGKFAAMKNIPIQAITAIFLSANAADKFVEEKNRGANDFEAFALAGISCAVHIAAKKFGKYVSNKLLPEEVNKLVRQTAKTLSESGFSNIANNVAEKIMLGDREKMRQTIDRYLIQGYSQAEAIEKAFFELNPKEELLKMYE